MLSTPLASELRPEKWGDILGQDHLLGPNGPLANQMNSNDPPSQSMVLYGPPGTGKTTIARLIARSAVFVELSAISNGVAAVRDEIELAAKRRQTFDQRTVLFVDEIHRFAKNQQEALLAAVESGVVTLIGATTEYPGTNVVRALLSRCLVFELRPLDKEAISSICDRAVSSGLLGRGLSISDEARNAIIRHAAGDARRALNLLQASAAQLSSGELVIGEKEIEASGVERVLDFDLDGTFHYDTISAFIKSVRGSDVNAALEYLALMISAGERPEFIGRRLMILAAEDIGLADPAAMSVAVAANSIAMQVGLPEARIPLAEATIYLALAPKSNSAYQAINRAIDEVATRRPAIPEHLTRAGAAKYTYPHDFNPPIASQRYRIGKAEYYQPGKQGFESEVAQRLTAIKSILDKATD